MLKTEASSPPSLPSLLPPLPTSYSSPTPTVCVPRWQLSTSWQRLGCTSGTTATGSSKRPARQMLPSSASTSSMVSSVTPPTSRTLWGGCCTSGAGNLANYSDFFSRVFWSCVVGLIAFTLCVCYFQMQRHLFNGIWAFQVWQVT